MNLRPKGGARLLLGLLPILAALLLYFGLSAAWHIGGDPRGSILPTPAAMAGALLSLARIDPASGHAPLIHDTALSVWRLFAALVMATLLSLLTGLALGLLPFKRVAWSPLLRAVAAIPPIAILPVLCVAFGLGEGTKIALLVLGVAPFMIRDLSAHIAAIPEEQLVKAQTLGASTWQVALRIALPQALPRLIGSVRASLGPAWVLLIATEALAADGGLGFRIFEAGRLMRMDVIIPYIVWISLLAAAADYILAQVSRQAFGWAHPVKGPR